MTVHLLKGSGAVVTGANNKIEARSMLREALYSEAREDETWVGRAPVVEYGRVVPAETNDAIEGAELYWRAVTGKAIEGRGVAMAFVWRAS